ncbi:hypothetical protein [Halomarina oriensis]|uniref:Uncharacterized protein n=1 Tax=Halomarina oriensis TaxID=671145 RepID=A0A6B0GE20_9EURY|nr:hypothetical protein [Halomarina oriensis]MWG32944.1 hypothetical protein [Halomarina oriensis]
MTTGRTLPTESDREYLEGEHGDQREYEARSRVKARITGPLAEEVAYLAAERPDLLEEVRDVVRAVG